MRKKKEGPWIQVNSGRKFYVLRPENDMISIEDIAHALSNQCRFAGHSKSFYSVAQHCVVVANQILAYNSLYGLLHDAAEAYLGDFVTPVKKVLREYHILENIVQRRVWSKFNLPIDENIKIEIRRCDIRALATEQRDLMTTHLAWPQTKYIKPLKDKIIPLPPKEAKNLFMEKYYEAEALHEKEIAEESIRRLLQAGT